MHVAGFPGASRRFQGRSRGFQGPPGGSTGPQGPARPWARLKFHAGWSGWTRPPMAGGAMLEACLKKSRGVSRDLNALRLDALANKVISIFFSIIPIYPQYPFAVHVTTGVTTGLRNGGPQLYPLRTSTQGLSLTPEIGQGFRVKSLGFMV